MANKNFNNPFAKPVAQATKRPAQVKPVSPTKTGSTMQPIVRKVSTKPSDRQMARAKVPVPHVPAIPKIPAIVPKGIGKVRIPTPRNPGIGKY